MKILHLVQKPQLRGAEVFAAQLTHHINQYGHQAILVFLFPGNINTSFTKYSLNLNGNQKKRTIDIKAWRKLAAIIKKEQPDIIQANAGDTLKYAVCSKLLFRWKQPIVFRNASTISLYIKNRLVKSWNNFFFRYANKIISVSKASAIDFANLYPQYQKKIVTIPIGIEKDEKGIIEKNKKLTVDRPVMVHVGGFTFEKNHKGLINIFETVLQHYPEAVLHLIGDGPLKKEIEEMVSVKELGKQVTFFGYQQQAMTFIRNADVLLLPSHIEGLPGVILESFICKTPVVAYNVGGIKEVVINNQTGRTVEKGDEETFVKEVLAALEISEHNQKLVENAYDLVVSQYLNTQITQKFLNVYASVIASGN